MELRRDMIISGPFWPETVRVTTALPLGEEIQLQAVGTRSGRAYDELLPLAALDQITEHRLGGASDAIALRLALEARRIRLAYTYDPHFAVSVSQIDPLPHQLEAVYHHLLQLPQIRFLLADDPGAGKTIMAGLLLKELKLRGAIERVLIVAPAKLTRQWQRELRDKFHESFDLVDRSQIRSAFGRNWWAEHNQVIASLDFLWPEDIQESLKGARWDLVIVDEAHHMAAYRHGAQGRMSATRRYRVGELLRERTDHILMLTATPHKGDPHNFALLMQLLDRDLDVTPDLLRQVPRAEDAPNPFFLRRLKEDMVDFEGRKLFPPRTVQTTLFSLTPPEQDLYEAVTDYFRRNFARAADEQNRNVSLAMTVLQRRLTSSIAAITSSLERRMKRLQSLQTQPQETWAPAVVGQDEDSLEDLEEMDDADLAQLEERVATLTTARTRGELEQEINELDRLVKLAQSIRTPEAKWTALQGVLEDLRLADSNEKLLIFTEHKDTLDMLVGRLRHMGFQVTCIHGGMDMLQRIAAEQEFWQRAQLMVATEAAGEGINLQCAHLMINYDIPWNPTRLEQRMGRVHRYLQNKPVFIYNMVTRDTIEGRVLDLLLGKLARMRDAMGNDRVYDVVSQVLDFGPRSLADLIRDAILRVRDVQEIEANMDAQLDPSQRRRVEEIGLLALATRYMDMNRLRAERQDSREQRLMPEYVERFFNDALTAVGGKATRRRDGLWQVPQVPAALRDGALPSVSRYGRPGESYRWLTFYKPDRNDPAFENTPELIGPGHPLFEAVLDLIGQRYGAALDGGALFYDPEASAPYLLWFVQLGVRDGRHETVGTRIYAVRENVGQDSAAGVFSRVAPGALIDLVPAPRGTALPADLAAHFNDDARRAVLHWAAQSLLPGYFAEMQERRQREVELRRRYLEFSLDHMLGLVQQRMFDAEGRAESDENYRIAYISAKQRYDELMARRTQRRAELAQEAQLIKRMPEWITAVVVQPLPVETRARSAVLAAEGLDMTRNDEVERIAMELVIAYEAQQRKWVVEDVSAEKIGFDVRSTHPEGVEHGVRCIEVKGRAGEGGVLLTSNEWIKAQRLGDDFWLYIVSNAMSQPRLHLIQNPAAQLRPEELQEIVRYFVPPDAWQRVAQPVEGTDNP